MESNIPANLKIWREYYGLSLEKVAEFLNVTHTTISNYETGKRDIPLNVLSKLAEDLYGIDLSVLINQTPIETQIDTALCFRSTNLSGQDLSSIANFKKIVKNYFKLLMLEKNHG